jgi:ABC-2 type transport system permease protein
MMLWYKAWRESRVRFLLMVVFVVGYCAYYVLAEKHERPIAFRVVVPANYVEYVYLFSVTRLAFYFFVFFFPLLGMGGLLRERKLGTAALSLSLPVSRSRQVGVRAAVGLLQMMVLSFLPSVLIPALSPIVGESYPISAEIHFCFLRTVCGAALFAMDFLFSTILAGEYTALMVSIGVTMLYFFIAGIVTFSFRLAEIAGLTGPLIDVRRFTGLPAPFPWIALSAFGMVALALLVLAMRITRQQDF